MKNIYKNLFYGSIIIQLNFIYVAINISQKFSDNCDKNIDILQTQ